MTAAHAVGLDVGTTHTKAVLVALDGDAACVPLAVAIGPTPDDAPGLLERAAGLIGEVVGRAGVAPDVVGIATMAETGVPLDSGGEPLTPLLRWDRQHGREQAAALAHAHGAHALFAATGVRPSGKAPLAVLAWLGTQPGLAVRMHRWVGVADLLVLALTGTAVTDHTLAGRTMAYRLPRPGEAPPSGFDGELLALAGMRPSALSAVADPTGLAGVVRSGQAAAPFLDAGLRAGTPVVVAGHDHAVGAWACGARGVGAAVDSLGTSEAVLTLARGLPDTAAVLDAGMSLVTTVSGAHRAVIAGAAGGAVLRSWLERLDPPDPAALLAAVAQDVLAFGDPVVDAAPPYLTGRQAPVPDPAARFVAPAATDPVRATRAVLEGLALHARWMLAVQGSLAGGGAAPAARAADRLHLIAPDRLPDAWLELKRLATGRPIAVTRVAEPVATGAALLGAVRAGLLGGDVADLLAGDAPVLAAQPLEVPERDPYAPALARFVARAVAPRMGSGPDGPGTSADVPARSRERAGSIPAMPHPEDR